jgi:hypothetical protein
MPILMIRAQWNLLFRTSSSPGKTQDVRRGAMLVPKIVLSALFATMIIAEDFIEVAGCATACPAPRHWPADLPPSHATTMDVRCCTH